MKTVLCIAGSDPTGGAGIASDLRTCAALGVHGGCVLTAATAQTTGELHSRGAVGVEQVVAQLEAVEDLDAQAVKVGMLPTVEVAEAVAHFVESNPQLPVVCDPVLHSSSGGRLCEDGVLQVLRSRILQRAELMTPNHPELEVMIGREVAEDEAALKSAAAELRQRGARSLLLKGGHRSGDEVVDWLFDGDEMIELRHERVGGIPARGTGCALSTAIAALLARERPLADAVREASDFLHTAIETSYFVASSRMRVLHLLWEFYGSEGLP